MKLKKLTSLLLATAMTATLLAGCGGDSNSGSGSEDGKKTIAIVTKSAGNPYNEKEAEGFQEVIEAAGATCIVKHPEAATADAQVSVI